MQPNKPKFISNHEDLEVYQIAFNAAMEIFQLSKSFPKEEKYSLTDRIRRSSREVASLEVSSKASDDRSVSANLAEAWRSGGSPRRRKTQGNVHQDRRRYKGSFLLRLNDAEAVHLDTASHKAAETQVWLKFAVKCQYLPIDSGRKLYSQYNQILGLIVVMTNSSDKWLLKKKLN